MGALEASREAVAAAAAAAAARSHTPTATERLSGLFTTLFFLFFESLSKRKKTVKPFRWKVVDRFFVVANLATLFIVSIFAILVEATHAISRVVSLVVEWGVAISSGANTLRPELDS